MIRKRPKLSLQHPYTTNGYNALRSNPPDLHDYSQIHNLNYPPKENLMDRLGQKEQVYCGLQAFILLLALIEGLEDIKLQEKKKIIDALKQWTKNKKTKAELKKLKKGIKSTTTMQGKYNEALLAIIDAVLDKDHTSKNISKAMDALVCIVEKTGVITPSEFMDIWHKKVSRLTSITADKLENSFSEE